MKKNLLVVFLTLFCLFQFPFFLMSAEITSRWLDNNCNFYWGSACNWNKGVPNNNSTDQFIAKIHSHDTIYVDGHFTINSLDHEGTLNIGTNNYLSLVKENATSTIKGNIYISDGDSGYNYAQLLINSNHRLSGGGNIFFSTPYQNKISGNGYLIIGSDLTIKTDNTYEGNKGYIDVGLTNNGVISADNGYIKLSNRDKVNNGEMKAINGGSLEIYNLTLTNNGNGLLSADNASSLIFTKARIENMGVIETVGSTQASELNEATIKGGRVNFGGDLKVTGTSHLESSGGNFVLGGKTSIGTNANLYLQGTIINNGELILEDSDPRYNNAELYIKGDVNLNGNGIIKFNSANQNNIVDGGYGRLNIGANQKIISDNENKGYIQVGLTNNGVISADNGSITLSNFDKVNKNLIECKNSGWLSIYHITLTNTDAQLSVDETSTIELKNAKIIGGDITGKGLVDIAGTSTLDGTYQPVSIEPKIETGTSENLYLQGTIINNGELILDDTESAGYNNAELYIKGEVNLNGNGIIKFNSANQNNIVDGGYGHLTVGRYQLITADAGTTGSISVPTTLYGVIQANGGTLNLPSILTNNGLIRAANGSNLDIKNNVGGTGSWEADGGSLNVKADITTTGKIDVKNSGELKVQENKSIKGSDLIMDDTATISVDGKVILTGDLSFGMADENKWQWGDNSELQMAGNSQYLEVGGEDLGANQDGFNNNFALRHLTITGTVTLRDLVNNGNGHSNEALYVYDLDVLEGATLNLNGINLYTMYDLNGNGTLSPYLVLAGDGHKFGGGIIVNNPVPLPSAIYLLGTSLIGLLVLRRNRQSL